MATASDDTLIRAFVRYGQDNGRAALKTIWDRAFTDATAGVTITSVSFEGSAQGGQITMAPDRLLAICEAALDRMDAADAGGQRWSHVDYSRQMIRT